MADDKWTKLTAQAREFVSFVAAGDVAKATPHLNDAMKQAMPGDGIKQLWTGLEGQAGKYDPAGPNTVKTATEDKYDCVYIESKFEKTNLWVKVVFEGDKVAGLQFVPNAP